MNTRDIVLIALFAAFIVALAFFPPINIPMVGVPITAQSMGIMLAGAVLGANRGALSVVLVLALVAIGLPVLSGGRGGLGIFMGPSAGFLFAWPLAAYVTGFLYDRAKKINVINGTLFCIIGGILALYPLGIAWISVNVGISMMKATTGSLAFIPGDIIKAVIAAYVAIQVRKVLGSDSKAKSNATL